MSKHDVNQYYVPESSPWPMVMALALLLFVVGVVGLLHQSDWGLYVFILGALGVLGTMYAWFSDVVFENRNQLHNDQMDRSYRWGMFWFIFSEVMFFAAFFGALYYTRALSVPWLGGEGAGASTHYLLWPEFQARWPLMINPSSDLQGPKDVISAWSLPAINTLLLLTSGVTVTWAHYALKAGKRLQLNIGLLLTVLLGIAFLFCQAHEYAEAYEHLGLTLGSGIYGSTFFMLTGFHGLHVTIGTIMLSVILLRCLKGHFSEQQHFGFEAVAWYWHFVDVVWLLLFVLVYWL